MRIGQGFDVHAFQHGGKLVLGGVQIPYPRGLAAHSDGDVLLHALCDAMLGAAGLGDIGKHFPDTDSAWAGIDSRQLLRRVNEKIRADGFRVSNADLVLVAQAPRLAPYVEKMCWHISEDLQVARGRINVKATTTEYLGFAGRKEGIAAFAVVLLDE
jgi:2-C-methyl-D-erythritol 2,4-cyclodiphosphate synthase